MTQSNLFDEDICRRSFVYIITNTETGKYYVGKNVDRRGLGLESYLKYNFNRALKGESSKPYLYNAMRKFPNLSSWAIAPLISAPSDTIATLERMFIADLRSRDKRFGYNIAAGGEGGRGSGYTCSEEHKRHVSEARKGIKFSREHRLHISEANRRKPKNSLSTLALIALNISRKGKAQVGGVKRHSAETKAAMCMAQRSRRERERS